VEGGAHISPEIVARYAGDVAREVPGVTRLVESTLHRHAGVRVTGEAERSAIVVHLAVEWGAPVQGLGRELQQRVSAYLERMAGVRPASIDVVVEEVDTP
jgi:uncharacterized alkaline shock family protein YloU